MRLYVVLASVIFLAGCTGRMYGGPRRPARDVALIQIDGTAFTRIDGQRAGRNKLEVLPGIHALAVALDDNRSPTGRGVRADSDRSLVVCFAAHAGHAYRARQVYSSGRVWRPEIVDETRAEPVKSWPIDPRFEHC